MSISQSNHLKNSLFIGDLSIFCSEDDLRNIFSPFGELLEIKIMKSEDKGRSLSYGFVKYADTNCASHALNELQHVMLHGRNLRYQNNFIGSSEI
jgi:RNA recognition motif-containing protein